MQQIVRREINPAEFVKTFFGLELSPFQEKLFEFLDRTESGELSLIRGRMRGGFFIYVEDDFKNGEENKRDKGSTG